MNKPYEKFFEKEDYVGQHSAPEPEENAPLYDVTINGIYPKDIYSSMGARYYGDGQPFDNQSISIIHAYRGKPDKPVRIYRAVPKVLTVEEQIEEYENQKRYILKTGKIPKSVTNWADKSEYYDFISNEIDKLKALPQEEIQKKININKGDWVTVTRQYAVDHGQSHLNNKFKVLSKVVKAKDLFTDGNSIHEWGYNPQ
jgi:hypothetical protein